MEGWISLHRKIQENWIWKSTEVFDKRSAWISMLLKANHKDTKVMADNKLIEVKKGSFVTSENKLAKEWKWGRKKARTFLQKLEDDKMIKKTGTAKWTIISIEKWELYQIKKQDEEQRGNKRRNK